MLRLIFVAVVASSLPVQKVAAAPAGVYLRYTKAEANGNSSVYAKNDTNKAVTVKYIRTVNSVHGGGSSERTITVQPRSEERLGYTCAFDVTYTALCGSVVSYQLL